ncbi:hypothetical protein BDY19DRAFT_1008324 [Irpex rosettiformis]|uniref:Uncharacterized protein n=1 Tax=Irpex rosettiformis TaxID=378272 RepID=A0ACB8U1S3_9APHY|nr:hypothetical protein BDY19DRAFT_1008324 [Irpex rosettiformis]
MNECIGKSLIADSIYFSSRSATPATNHPASSYHWCQLEAVAGHAHQQSSDSTGSLTLRVHSVGATGQSPSNSHVIHTNSHSIIATGTRGDLWRPRHRSRQLESYTNQEVFIRRRFAFALNEAGGEKLQRHCEAEWIPFPREWWIVDDNDIQGAPPALKAVKPLLNIELCTQSTDTPVMISADYRSQNYCGNCTYDGRRTPQAHNLTSRLTQDCTHCPRAQQLNPKIERRDYIIVHTNSRMRMTREPPSGPCSFPSSDTDNTGPPQSWPGAR